MNRETFTQHIRQELSSLRRFLLAAYSGNGNEADDVAQEVLMKAYVASRRFEDEEGFSAYLLLLPEWCVEHVVVHELCHLLEPSHNTRFHALMDKFFPRWKEARKETRRLLKSPAA